jgi:hypothetical protein
VLKQFRYAMYLDGVDDYVLVRDSPSLRITQSFTISTWFATLTSSFLPVNTHPFLKYSPTSYYGLFHGWGVRPLQVAINNGTTSYATPVVNLPDIAIHFVTGLYDYANAQLRLYIDAELKSSASVPAGFTIPPNTADIKIPFDFGRPQMYGNILVYSKALTDSEILWNYNYPENPVRNGLVLWLQADPQYVKDIDGDGRLEWIDLSGYGNHGKIYGAQLVQLIKTPARTLTSARVLSPAR